MNILSINASPAQPAFTANRGERKVRGEKPSNYENQKIKVDRFYDVSKDSADKLELKIKYLEKRRAAEMEYLQNKVESFAEKRPVENTIRFLTQEIDKLKKALTKAAAKRV